MLPSLTGVTINNLRPLEAVPIQKQVQCTQDCWIEIGSETSIYQLATPYSLHQKYMKMTKQQLKKSW